MTESSPNVTNVADQLTLLEERRAALQRIIRITQSLESLQQGLQTVSSMRDASKGFPEDAIRIFEALGRKVRNLSDAEVKVRLDNLDQKVKAKLNLVLELADELDLSKTQAVDGIRLDVVNQLVDEFKKHAQTAIALRVLLEKRGVPAKALALNIPEQIIKDQLDQISSRESLCRGEVVRQVATMQVEVEKLLSNPELKPAMYAILAGIAQALQANLDHLKAGRPISQLPVPIADIAIDVTPFSGVSYAQPEPAKGTPSSPPTAEKADDQTQAKPKSTAVPTAQANIQSDSAVSPPKPKGFWNKVNHWLNSPWKVGWKDIDRDK